MYFAPCVKSVLNASNKKTLPVLTHTQNMVFRAQTPRNINVDLETPSGVLNAKRKKHYECWLKYRECFKCDGDEQ